MSLKRRTTFLDSENQENDINMTGEDVPSTPKRTRIEDAFSPTSAHQNSSPMSVLDTSPPRKGRPMKGKFKFTPKLPPVVETSASPVPTATPTPTANRAAKRAQAAETKRISKDTETSRLLSLISKPVKDGGFGFQSLWDFVETTLKSRDPHLSSVATQFALHHGAELIELLHSRAPGPVEDASMDLVIPILQREGQAIQELLSRDWFKKDRDLLQEFSLEGLSTELKECAPVLWRLLEEASRAKESARDAIPVRTFSLSLYGEGTDFVTGTHFGLRHAGCGAERSCKRLPSRDGPLSPGIGFVQTRARSARSCRYLHLVQFRPASHQEALTRRYEVLHQSSPGWYVHVGVRQYQHRIPNQRATPSFRQPFRQRYHCDSNCPLRPGLLPRSRAARHSSHRTQTTTLVTSSKGRLHSRPPSSDGPASSPAFRVLSLEAKAARYGEHSRSCSFS